MCIFIPFADNGNRRYFCQVFFLRSILVSSLFAFAAFGVTLPNGLSPTDIDTLVSEIGPTSASRFLRSAESYVAWPGIKFGVEVMAVATRDLPGLGNANGSAPSYLPAPRIYLVKGLGADFELLVNGMPAMRNSIATWGLGLKWAAQTEEETWLAIAGFLTYTHVDGFDGGYLGNDIEFGAILSKDYVRLKPYFVVGALVAQGEVAPSLAATVQRASWQGAFHLAVGAEIELPVNFTLQFDLMNFYPMGTFLISKKF